MITAKEAKKIWVLNVQRRNDREFRFFGVFDSCTAAFRAAMKELYTQPAEFLKDFSLIQNFETKQVYGFYFRSSDQQIEFRLTEEEVRE